MNLLLLMSGNERYADCFHMRCSWNPVWVLMTSKRGVHRAAQSIAASADWWRGGGARRRREITPIVPRSLERRLLNIVEERRWLLAYRYREFSAIRSGDTFCGGLASRGDRRDVAHWNAVARGIALMIGANSATSKWRHAAQQLVVEPSASCRPDPGQLYHGGRQQRHGHPGDGICLIGGVESFGRNIQALVSHQREFLADASAVQFTRNPMGLAGALKRIGASQHGSEMRCANRSELSHLLFSAGTPDEIFDSHPPLLERIQRLEPGFTGDFTPWSESPQEDAPVPATDATANPTSASTAPSEAAEIPTVAVVLPTLDPDLRETLVHPDNAAAALYGLLLSEDEDVRRRQCNRIAVAETTALANRRTLARRTAGMDRTVRRQVLDLATVGVRQRPPAGRESCLALARELADADHERSLFEVLLLGRMQRALWSAGVKRALFDKPLPPARVRAEAATVLGVMAYLGQPQDDAAAEAAWREGVSHASSFRVDRLPMPARRDCTLTHWEAAVQRLDGLTPFSKGGC